MCTVPESWCTIYLVSLTHAPIHTLIYATILLLSHLHVIDVVAAEVLSTGQVPPVANFTAVDPALGGDMKVGHNIRSIFPLNSSYFWLIFVYIVCRMCL